jgi:hypothetical protein
MLLRSLNASTVEFAIARRFKKLWQREFICKIWARYNGYRFQSLRHCLNGCVLCEKKARLKYKYLQERMYGFENKDNFYAG